jgi:hypothetical protein
MGLYVNTIILRLFEYAASTTQAYTTWRRMRQDDNQEYPISKDLKKGCSDIDLFGALSRQRLRKTNKPRSELQVARQEFESDYAASRGVAGSKSR